MATVSRLVVSVPLAGGQILPYSPTRVAVIFSAPPANRYTLDTQPAPVLDQGINMLPGIAPLQITRAAMGQLAQHAIFAISAVAAQTIVVFEILE